MQTNANHTNDIVTTWGAPALSALVIIFVAIAALAHQLAWDTAVQVFYIILGANGLYLATKWQAAPGLLNTMQAIIQQLADHIQALHLQQASTPTTITKIVPTPIALPADASPVPARASAEPTQTSA